MDLMEPSAISWFDPYKWNGLFNGTDIYDSRRLVYANGHLYIASYLYDHSAPYAVISRFIIDSYPLTDITSPPSLSRQVHNVRQSNYDNYFFAGTKGNSAYVGVIGNYNKTVSPPRSPIVPC